MIEQYIFNKVTADPTLQALLTDGAGGYHVYPTVVPRGIDTLNLLTFTRVGTTDVYPASESVDIQFNIFTKAHLKSVEIAQALAALFNEDNNQPLDGGTAVVYSQRKSESDLGFDYDDKEYQREATYYFKLR